ncbi:Exocyst complex component EXO84 [Ceratocystis lukuohia]|uniref:Exocyst complex component EXO84 n=1 Tax=Ceratocystis lukuohia TaxID=2019550 RepID=A0ABR4MU31_9PEZI
MSLSLRSSKRKGGRTPISAKQISGPIVQSVPIAANNATILAGSGASLPSNAPRSVPAMSAAPAGSAIGGGGPAAAGPPPAAASAAIPEARRRVAPPAGDKTSDLVKRRYSTRFNNANAPEWEAGAPPMMPPMPSIPSVPSLPHPSQQQYENRSRSRSQGGDDPSGAGGAARDPRRPPQSRDVGGGGGGGGASGSGPQVDLKALRDPNLSADQYVSSVLAEATDEEIRSFEDSLRKVKSRAAYALQQNVMQNRTQIIKISKETEKLKTEMRTLRNLMAELKVNTTALRTSSSKSQEGFGGDGLASGIGPGSGAGMGMGMSKKDKRSSITDRSALWNSQMQALYKSVEGSQKFFPNSLGRHVLQNGGPWIELDNATYKSRRAMQIFLLNDHLLIASRKKRKNDGPDARGPATKLVADRCWPLLDIEVVDMAGTGDTTVGRSKLADAVMVRGVGQDTFIYRTERPESPDKNLLMLNIRKAVEELRRSLQSEMEANNKAKDTINYFASRDPGLLQNTELLETLSDVKDMLIEVGGKQHNLRWVESQMDELDIDISLQNLEPAVARVEKLRGLARGLKTNVVAQDFITFKVEERCGKLAELILHRLAVTHGLLSKTRENANWLARLGFEDRARETYLATRREMINTRSRLCIFQGDLHMYIWEISFVYFKIIRHTVSCFQACFPPVMMSVCVKWAKEMVEAFNEILARQLSSTQRGGDEWNQCISRAKEHAKFLSEVGLDFQTLVGKNLVGEEER